jgi:hypothetical protein
MKLLTLMMRNEHSSTENTPINTHLSSEPSSRNMFLNADTIDLSFNRKAR